jgi:hypothetical protein
MGLASLLIGSRAYQLGESFLGLLLMGLDESQKACDPQGPDPNQKRAADCSHQDRK